jgi:hypothetical protein
MPSFIGDEYCDYAEARHVDVPHGTHCDCVLLAAAVRLEPRAISYEFCRNMLQRRWSMTCKHGEVKGAAPATLLAEKWRDKGDMNPVLAILVKNG